MDVDDTEKPLPSAEVEVEPVDPLGGLRPRQRRLAQLLAEGKSNAQIQEELGYSTSRISILQGNPLIRAEVARLQDKIFEESIEARLKSMNESALNHIHFVLTDKQNRVKVSEKNEIAKWLIEMQKSKAPQMHDVGENMLSIFLDKLDARKTHRKELPSPSSDLSHDQIPGGFLEVESRDVTPEPVKPETKDDLIEWIDDFYAESK